MSIAAIAIRYNTVIIIKTGKGTLLEALPNLVTASSGFKSLRSYAMLRISPNTLWLSSHHSSRYLGLKAKIRSISIEKFAIAINNDGGLWT